MIVHITDCLEIGYKKKIIKTIFTDPAEDIKGKQIYIYKQPLKLNLWVFLVLLYSSLMKLLKMLKNNVMTYGLFQDMSKTKHFDVTKSYGLMMKLKAKIFFKTITRNKLAIKVYTSITLNSN